MSRHLHIIGGGIAGLASAVFAIRDGGLRGDQISIIEEAPDLGGSLDAFGSFDIGYAMRGERMLSKHFVCLFDLLSKIPSYDDAGVNARDDIVNFTREASWHARARLVDVSGVAIPQGSLGLDNRDRLSLLRLMLRREASLEMLAITDVFHEHFFQTNFWLMWCTMFAFQPWHSAIEMRRYLLRFLHLFPYIASMITVHRTRYDQYHSIVVPILRWLEGKGVAFEKDTAVLDMRFSETGNRHRVTALRVATSSGEREVALGERDLVIFTNGSMTADSSVGVSDEPARLVRSDRTWRLWRSIADKHRGFGNPRAFFGDIDKSKWLSFTVTTTGPLFRQLIEGLSKMPLGREGLITLANAPWLVTIKANTTPHIPRQPPDSTVWWGYGLRPDRKGAFVDKAMAECTGQELLREVFGHLHFDVHMDALLSASKARPCMMPYITSQFMPRSRSDRPEVVPAHCDNLAFVGQFCELPDDTVFTVEYSVRSAMTAVKHLLNAGIVVPAIYKGWKNPAVVLRAAREAFR